jgi:hypothetical protein
MTWAPPSVLGLISRFRPRSGTGRHRFKLTLGLAVCQAIVACAPRPYADPVAVMLDREADDRMRRRAVEQTQQTLGADPRRVEALQRLVIEPGYPVWLREHAVEELTHIDEASFRGFLRKNLHRISGQDTLTYVLERAVQGKWVDLTPAIVRRCADPVAPGVSDAERPERRALEQLHEGRDAASLVWSMFIDDGKLASPGERVAAWVLLNRLWDPMQLRARLREAPASSALVVDLKACQEELGILPEHVEGVLRLVSLRDASQRAFWDRAAIAVSRLRDDQRAGLELRHLPILLRLSESQPAADREQLLTRLRDRLRSRQNHLLGSQVDFAGTRQPQLLQDWAAKLSWGDLVTIELLLGCLEDPSFVAAMFEQAQADRRDTLSEHGGVLDIDEATRRPIARSYAPLAAQSDQKFLPSPRMIEDVYTAVAHYHFHAQQYHHSDYAGPGSGDIALAERLGFHGLVLTFVDRDRLNVDYYQPGGVTIDLGTLRRGP